MGDETKPGQEPENVTPYTALVKKLLKKDFTLDEVSEGVYDKIVLASVRAGQRLFGKGGGIHDQAVVDLNNATDRTIVRTVSGAAQALAESHLDEHGAGGNDVSKKTLEEKKQQLVKVGGNDAYAGNSVAYDESKKPIDNYKKIGGRVFSNFHEDSKEVQRVSAMLENLPPEALVKVYAEFKEAKERTAGGRTEQGGTPNGYTVSTGARPVSQDLTPPK